MKRRAAFFSGANAPSILVAAAISIMTYHLVFGAVRPASASFAPSTGTSSKEERGPSWTVTPVMWGDATKQYVCVVSEGGKDIVGMNNGRAEPADKPKYMAVYRLNPNGNMVDIELIGNREIEYDLKIPHSAAGSQTAKLMSPFDVEKKLAELEKEATERAEKARKERERKEKEKERDNK